MSSDENDFSSEDEDFVPDEVEDSDEEQEDTANTQCDVEYKDDVEKMDQAKKIWEAMKKESGSTTKSLHEKSVNISSSDTMNPSNKQTRNGNSNLSDLSTAKSKLNNPSSNDIKLDDTITITKVYDFAGEEVTVKKEVKRDSKEAISHLKQSTSNSGHQSALSRMFNKSGPNKSMKRPGGIGNVLGKIGKKPKLSTLEKSKIDWNVYKEETGIGNELLSYNKGKDGYLEKVSFLQRTDMRQYEHEKALRLGKKS